MVTKLMIPKIELERSGQWHRYISTNIYVANAHLVCMCLWARMFSIPNFMVIQDFAHLVTVRTNIKEKGYETMDVRRDTTDELRPDCRAGAEIMEKAMSVAVGKTTLSSARCFVSAIMAGMFIGSGALFMLFVKSDSSLSFAPSQVLGGICFSVGLICVVVAGAELFTGNNLMVCAKQCDRIAWNDMLKNWVLVWGGNFVGSLLLVCIVFFANSAAMNGGNVGNAMINVACAKIDLPWMTIFFRGILCNFLVCLAVWMSFAGKTVLFLWVESCAVIMAADSNKIIRAMAIFLYMNNSRCQYLKCCIYKIYDCKQQCSRYHAVRHFLKKLLVLKKNRNLFQ